MLWTFTRDSHALSTTADSITIDVPAGRGLLIHSLEGVGLESAAAVACRVGVYDVTTLGSGGTPTSLVIKAWGSNADGYAVPTGLLARYGFTTQPVLGDLRHTLAFQPLGGRDKLPLIEPLGFWKSTAYQVSIRAIAGANLALLKAIIELA